MCTLERHVLDVEVVPKARIAEAQELEGIIEELRSRNKDGEGVSAPISGHIKTQCP